MEAHHSFLLYSLITYTHFHSPSIISPFSKKLNAPIRSLAAASRMNSHRYIGQITLLCMFRSRARSLSKQVRMNLSSIIDLLICRDCKQLNSGNSIPRIGYGTYQLKGKECLEGVRWALETGYTHIDTASIYKNEVEVGTVLKEMKIDRSKVYITSKIAPAEQGYDEAIKACNQILERLGCGYLDLLIIHWPGVGKVDSKSEQNRIIRRETWNALVQLKIEGKVKDIGVSNYLKHHLEDLLKHSQVKPAINQFQIHPLLWEKDTIQFCQKNEIAIEAYSPLARSDPRLLSNAIIKDLAKKYKKTEAQICLRWALQHDFIVLPKYRSKQRIVENFNINDFVIELVDMIAIDSLRKEHVRTCWDPNIITY